MRASLWARVDPWEEQAAGSAGLGQAAGGLTQVHPDLLAGAMFPASSSVTWGLQQSVRSTPGTVSLAECHQRRLTVPAVQEGTGSPKPGGRGTGPTALQSRITPVQGAWAPEEELSSLQAPPTQLALDLPSVVPSVCQG